LITAGNVRELCASRIYPIALGARDGTRAALGALVTTQQLTARRRREPAMTNAFSTIDLASLETVNGGADGRDIYGTIGNWVGGIGGGAAGAAGGAALAAPLSPVGQAAAAGAGGVAGERIGSAAGGAAGRGLWDAGSWIGEKVGNWMYPSSQPAPRRR
jgi:hypothetical protein